MFSEDDLRQLTTYQPSDKVLSVYLDIDPAFGAQGAKHLLRQMLRDFAEDLLADRETILRYADHEFDWAARSLALFSCAPDDFFRTFPLSLPIGSRARALNRPYVKPLVDLWDNYANIGVALVDKQAVRLFDFHLGALREELQAEGEAVRHTKRGGGSQAPGRKGGAIGQTRYAEELAERNLRESAAAATQFFRRVSVRRILLGGTEANLARFIALLPKQLQSLVEGTFAIEMNAPHAQVLERAMHVAQDVEHRKEERLVEAMVTAAAKGKAGVVRLDDTLEAVYAGGVRTLIVQEGFRAPGYRCQQCQYLTTQQLQSCPFCGSEFQRIEDAVELAISKVLENNGEVLVMRDIPALERAGHIGGLLRY
jgi:peptide subunit release factor 1 (eRF1)